ncbi:MAG: HAMP domain-containing sensor histidine kinase, partial [Thermoguttaceae bacterium]
MNIFNNGIGRDLRLWPMLCLLLIVVLAPTACLVWFMNRAIENERLAMLKTLEDAYRRDLSDAQSRLEHFWRDRAVSLDECAAGKIGSAVFAKCIRSGWADSVVCYDGQGRVSYPAATVGPSDQSEMASTEWQEARGLEIEENNPVAAAKAYAAIARESHDVNLCARALQAEARCLVQSGDREGAVNLIIGTLSEEKYARAVDLRGRLIVPNVQLMALQLMGKSSPLPLGEGQSEGGLHRASPEGKKELTGKLVDQLFKRLNDYDDPAISALQRRFLMQELKTYLEHLPSPGTDRRLVGRGAGGEGNQSSLTLALSGHRPKVGRERELTTLLPAEELAAHFVEQMTLPPRQKGVLQPSPLPGVWQLASSNGRLLALWRTETIVAESDSVISRPAPPGEVAVALRPPKAENPPVDVFYTIPAGKYLPNWQLTLSMTGGDATDAAANRRIAIYLWTGIIVIAAIAILAGFLLQVFYDQMRYTRLKNDLVATVSHELKTPLSSIRLLVDTLLDEQSPDLNKTRDYLQLIAKENARLSRLIDNFLTFSRMERNKHAFQFAAISPAAIINQVLEAVGERFQEPGCRLEADVAPDLPSIMADADALVTVVLNLLDNAYKYTGDEKHVVLRAYVENGMVCIAVTDNGIGLSRGAAKKIFVRFYQVDRRLSRSGGGCGLGLSIVKFIVTAHGGSVEVASRPNAGSTFT